MKRMLSMLFISTYVCLLIQAQGTNYESTIDVVAESESKTMQKEHDVVVSHENGEYVIEFNIKHGRKIETRRGIVRSEKVFDKASFTWESKNMVAIKLFDTNSMDTFELKLWGEKRSTSMQVER